MCVCVCSIQVKVARKASWNLIVIDRNYRKRRRRAHHAAVWHHYAAILITAIIFIFSVLVFSLCCAQLPPTNDRLRQNPCCSPRHTTIATIRIYISNEVFYIKLSNPSWTSYGTETEHKKTKGTSQTKTEG